MRHVEDDDMDDVVEDVAEFTASLEQFCAQSPSLSRNALQDAHRLRTLLHDAAVLWERLYPVRRAMEESRRPEEILTEINAYQQHDVEDL